MSIFRPVQKAPNEIIPFDDPRIRYPLYESRKYDGLRCLAFPDRLLTSSLKPFPNAPLKEMFETVFSFLTAYSLVLDGELWSPEVPFERLSGMLRSHSQTPVPGLRLFVFDIIPLGEWISGLVFSRYGDRYNYLSASDLAAYPQIEIVHQDLMLDASCAQARFEKRIEEGQEGSILRDPNGRYKHGRATHNESLMYKFKEFETLDAVITSVIQQRRMKPGVDRILRPDGYLDRPHEQASYELDDMLAGFNIQLADGTQCGVKFGKGFDNEAKKNMFKEWSLSSERYIGRHVEFKHMPHGSKDKPRIGSLVRFRPDLD